MNEPGKYVLLKKVQPSSKNIKRSKKQQEKKLKKKLEKVQPQKNPPHNNRQNGSISQSNDSVSGKKKKFKQKKSKQPKVDISHLKNQSAKEKNKKKVDKSVSESRESIKSFGDDLTVRLKASRFRFNNEQLYTQSSDQALEVFEQDDSAFTTYHEGYRKQVEQWPINPLDRIIKSIKKLPLNYVVADFGCGEARLAESITQKCYNFDLVAANNRVIACNMAQTPLPSESVNVAVFCLSLMGTNLKDFLLEANRVLKVGLKLCGFELLSKDISTKVFYFLSFKKVQNVSGASRIRNFSLKPCLYKKR